MMRVGTAFVELDSTKVLFEDDKELVLPGVLAREGVLRYSEGLTFRPASELESSLFTFEDAFVVAERHPDTMILTDPGLVSGRVTHVSWDAERGEVRGEVHLYKGRVSADFLAKVRSGVLSKNSIGFLYEEERVPGEWRGQRYDFVQRKILVDHVAVGVPYPRDEGCSLGVDALASQELVNESLGFTVTLHDDSDVREDAGASYGSAREGAGVVDPPGPAAPGEGDVRLMEDPCPAAAMVVERSRKLLGNVSLVGPIKRYDQRGMVRSPPRRGVRNSGKNEQVELY